MSTFSKEDNKKLMEEIKKVEVQKRKVPRDFNYYVSRKVLDSAIVHMGDEAIIEFFKAIGNNPFFISSWIPKRPIIKLAREALECKMIRNKRNGNYCLFPLKDSTKVETISFDPQMLMVNKDEEIPEENFKASE